MEAANMRDGYVRCAAATIKVSIGNPFQNARELAEKILEAEKENIKILVFPELVLSGYSCGDLFFQDSLLEGCKEALACILTETRKTDVLAFIGLPFSDGGRVYDAVAVVQKGNLLGIIAKSNLKNNQGGNEARYFVKAPEKNILVDFLGESVLLGSKIIFQESEKLSIACEVGEDLYATVSPASEHALRGANIVVNAAALPEFGNQSEMQKMLVAASSKRLICAYILSNAGAGESTTDLVYSGQKLIAENGVILKESDHFSLESVITEIDISMVNHDRRMNMQVFSGYADDYDVINVDFVKTELDLMRKYKRIPYLKQKNGSYHSNLQEMFELQVQGLVRRLSQIHCNTVIIGLSGGLDSTLAILVAARAMDVMEVSRKGIVAVTMPCFGTTDRTYKNACMLAMELGVTLKEISIRESVLLHFNDISHDQNIHDITYENAQARERTQVIMDLANQLNGIVIGTGDLSELALGWATYNGDLMSMYAVNASVPKTVVRLLVEDIAVTWKYAGLQKVLRDILETPVSPELLPPVEGVISQKTEELVGPYELHDFFIYHMFLNGSAPRKIYRLAIKTFKGEYSKETILLWLKTFYRRFFTQQFKRSCMPDGPKVTEISFSPRGNLCMPSDATVSLWLDELEQI